VNTVIYLVIKSYGEFSRSLDESLFVSSAQKPQEVLVALSDMLYLNSLWVHSSTSAGFSFIEVPM
jgi:hypothetical protein